MLLTQRHFLPLFITQFLGAFNDNVFKSALTMLVTYKLAAGTGYSAGVLVSLGGGIYILPYVLFSGLAGQMADKFEKSTIARLVKVSEVLLMGLGLFVLHAEHMTGLFILLFLMGTHSTFFSPVKYGILPQALPENKLVGANGLMEGSTFLAILFGTMYGGVFILNANGADIIGYTTIAIALAGLTASWFIPKSPGVSPDLHINKNFLLESIRVTAHAKQGAHMYQVIIAASWFWLLGAVILSLIPVYGAEILHGDEMVTTFLLSLFSVGIAVGSILCQRLFKNQVTLAYVPLAAVVMSVSGLLMVTCSHFIPAPATTALRAVQNLLTLPVFWPMILAFVFLAMAGGVFTVPLYAYMQAAGATATKSRLIAANNVINAIFMVAGAIASSTLIAAGVGILGVITILMVINLGTALYCIGFMPYGSRQKLLAAIMGTIFRIKVVNPQYLENLPDRLLVICNHQSFLDAALLSIYIPKRLTFAIDIGRSREWWIKPFLRIIKAFPIDPTNPYAIRNLINLVKSDKPCGIFPEGRLTQTGTLMKVYDGTAMVAINADAPLLPVHLEGLQFSKYTTNKVMPKRWFPQVTITIHPPVKLDVDPELRGRGRRNAAGQKLQRLMVNTFYASAPQDKTLFTALMQASRTYGPKTKILNDINLVPFTYKSLVARSILLGNVLKREGITNTNKLNTVGLLLPNANAAAATFFALQAVHAVPAMLNFSAGPGAVLSACKAALITNIITSHSFIEKAKLQLLIDKLIEADIKIVYLEDIRDKITLPDKLKLLLTNRYPEPFYKQAQGEINQPAVILFTSGSEGKPKGVVLSHRNIIANVAQAHAVVDFHPKDTLLNALPMFHSFGLTGGTLLPVLYGVPTFLYPSPLHYRIIPEMVYNYNATVMFGTDTFLTGYARYAHPYDFYRMRYVFAGAEKVRHETRKVWMEKFGIRLLDGYGATETSPVLSLNTPIAYKAGSVGKLLPGIEYKLGAVPGLEGGNLTVRGPNIMLGYLKSDNPGIIQPPEDGWYETGDIVTVDEAGFITIAGRLKRFAKIGGEMVSLGSVEALANATWPESQNAVVSLPDDRKGEQLILFTTHADATKEQFRTHSRSTGGAEIALPRHIHTIDKLPTLATGKIDYVSLTVEAEKLL